jgi:hypothetical protein
MAVNNLQFECSSMTTLRPINLVAVSDQEICIIALSWLMSNPTTMPQAHSLIQSTQESLITEEGLSCQLPSKADK